MGKTRRRKVYVLNDGGHDYSGAEKFGDVVICSNSLIKRDNISHMYLMLSEAMDDAKSDDLILVGSLTSLCMVAAAMMADLYGEVHLLLYHDGYYEERDLMLSAQS